MNFSVILSYFLRDFPLKFLYYCSVNTYVSLPNICSLQFFLGPILTTGGKVEQILRRLPELVKDTLQGFRVPFLAYFLIFVEKTFKNRYLPAGFILLLYNYEPIRRIHICICIHALFVRHAMHVLMHEKERLGTMYFMAA